MPAREEKREGLSLQTLLIASAASLTAAIVVHKIWQGGAILGAAITPIIVAVVSEALRKPAEVLTTAKPRVAAATPKRTSPTGTRVQGPAEDPRDPGLPPPSYSRPREDRFGIWEADKPSWHERLNRRHLKIALVTGLVAFAIAAVFLTGANLVTGGAGGGDRFTLLPGKQSRSDRERDRERERRDRENQTTQPATPAPEQDTPEQDTPQPTPTTPPEDEPPATTPTTPTTPTPTTPPSGTPPSGGAPAP